MPDFKLLLTALLAFVASIFSIKHYRSKSKRLEKENRDQKFSIKSHVAQSETLIKSQAEEIKNVELAKDHSYDKRDYFG